MRKRKPVQQTARCLDALLRMRTQGAAAEIDRIAMASRMHLS